MDLTSWIILTVISLILSGFFSGVEIAFITADRVRIGLDTSRGGWLNRIIARYYSHQEFFISTILVGNNIMLVIYGMGAAALLEPWIEAHISPNQGVVLLMQTIISTLVILFTGEFIPKSVFRINPNTSLKIFNKNVTFRSKDASNPAKFYINSTTAHKEYKTQLITIDGRKGSIKANCIKAGSLEESNDRVINQLIVSNVLEEGPCQLQMGLTELKPGSVWNTMPAHTHDRRVEAYFYFNVPEGNAICHLMGEPQENRLIWLHNEQAVMSPEWSIHAAAGTSNYMFIWGMGGENLNYGDMDKVTYLEMK